MLNDIGNLAKWAGHFCLQSLAPNKGNGKETPSIVCTTLINSHS